MYNVSYWKDGFLYHKRFNSLDDVTAWIKSLDDTEIIPLKLSKWNDLIQCCEPIFTYNELQ